MTHGKKDTYPRLADELGSVPPARLLDAVRAVVIVQRDNGDRANRKHARMKYLIADRGLAWFKSAVEAEAGFTIAIRGERCRPGTFRRTRLERAGRRALVLRLGRAERPHRDDGNVRTKSALREIAAAGHDLVATDQEPLIVDIAPEDRALVDDIPHPARRRRQEAASTFSLIALACPALPTCGCRWQSSARCRRC